MRHRIVATAATLVIVTSGCAQQATAHREDRGHITVEGNTHPTQTVSCRQVGWLMIIEAKAHPGSARAFLRLEGEKPAVDAVSITNFDGFNGVAGQGVEATAAEGTYTITGTAEGHTPDSVAKPRTVPFRIEAAC
ncbi:MAG TPA: lipoprotein LpqH [Mycobacterium sp.]|nr:lipoprotein LpqH [Mycobacterium sp.]